MDLFKYTIAATVWRNCGKQRNDPVWRVDNPIEFEMVLRFWQKLSATASTSIAPVPAQQWSVVLAVKYPTLLASLSNVPKLPKHVILFQACKLLSLSKLWLPMLLLALGTVVDGTVKCATQAYVVSYKYI
jgi:hypothetical protein